jgi:hypothetical protein
MKKNYLIALLALFVNFANAQQFIESTTYRGAFAPGTPMWTDSWTNYDPINEPYLDAATVVNVTAVAGKAPLLAFASAAMAFILANKVVPAGTACAKAAASPWHHQGCMPCAVWHVNVLHDMHDACALACSHTCEMTALAKPS